MAIYVKDIAMGSPLPASYEEDTAEDGDPVDCISVEDASNLGTDATARSDGSETSDDVSDLPDDVTVDYEKHAEKALVGPMRPILQTMGWTWTDVLTNTEQTGFGHFERSP